MGWLLTTLGLIKGALGLGEKVVAEVHDSNQRTAGANAVIAKDNAKAAEVSHDVAQAIVDTTDRSTSDDLRRGEF